MPKNTYYYYDHEACTFVEVQPQRHKILLRSLMTVALAFVLAGAGMWVVYETSTTPKELALQQENEALQQELIASSERFNDLSHQLDELADTDRDLYRTIFQTDPISEDVRQVGVGGAAASEFAVFSEPTSTLLQQNSSALDKLERQINLQRASYEELLALARERAETIPQMPAILPTAGALTSGFGVRLHPIHRVRKMHAGVDFSVPTGTPVYATGDGVIQHAGVSSGYGMNVRIRHPKAKRVTLYAHLSRLADDVRPGTRVKRGDVIGYSGNSGLSTAPHLHYEIRDLDGEPVNPVYSFAPGVRPSEYQELVRIAESENAPLD